MIPVYMAPLQGFTEKSFRQVYRRHFTGVRRYYSPFIVTVRSHKINNSILNDILFNGEIDNDLVPQILTNNAADFLRLAERINSFGYKFINLNFGCPYKMAVSKKRGAGILNQPEMVDNLLSVAVKQCRISVKIRIGNNSVSEMEEIIPILNKHNLEEVIIHPRLAKDMYSKPVDLAVMDKLISRIKSPVIYNGDIFSYNQYLHIKERYPDIKGVMLGRGLLINPFLPEEIEADRIIAPVIKRKRFKIFFDDLLEAFSDRYAGEKQIIDKLKGYWIYWGINTHSSRDLYKKIIRSSTIGEFKAYSYSMLNSDDFMFYIPPFAFETTIFTK